MTSRDSRTPFQHLVRTATVAACALVLALTGYVIMRVLILVASLTMAIIAALLVAALIGPLTARLKRIGLPASIAALSGVVGLLAVLATASYWIGRRAADQLDDLQVQIVEGADRLRRTLVDTVPGLDRAKVDDIAARVVRGLRNALPSPYAGVTTATETLAAVLLAIILLFFFLRDGDRMWTWLTGLVPASRRADADRAGRTAWHTLSSYTHGIVMVAAVDAVGIGAALFVLHVPLAMSLAVLTFLAAFVPVLGATLAGAAATLVTLVTNGTRDAVIVLIVVIVVQQTEGNLLHPIIMRRAVRLHPVVTLLAVTAGTLVAGIAGALIAVPACAVVYHAVLSYRGGHPGDDPPETADDSADSPTPPRAGAESAR
ncbi:AI-2E family transporter [Krasilnikovia sp. M28-CT-15]|uniref:AI-2E family transporter n=1 Tax=Krasilnikovia sp. M28-CT-15 TaxID=3373540 RepID=UPI003875CA69